MPRQVGAKAGMEATPAEQHAVHRALAWRKASWALLAIAIVLLLLVVVAGSAAVCFLLPEQFQRLPTERAPHPSAADPPQHQLACNPRCGTQAEACNPSTGTCQLGCSGVNSLPDGSVAFNTACLGGESGEVCLLGVPQAAGTVFLLQSAAPSAAGGSLALTAVPGATPCQPPTFALQATDLLNKAQHFTVAGASETMCEDPLGPQHASQHCCDKDVCPCACCDDNVGAFKPGDWGSDSTPFACSDGVAAQGIATCNSSGATVPCKNTFMVLATAPTNSAGGGWAVQAAPTLITSTDTAPVLAVDQAAATWRELPGGQAHLHISPFDCQYPAKGFRVVDASFDRCEASRAVQMVNSNSGAPSWEPITCFSFEEQPTTPSNTWYILPVQISAQAWYAASCDPQTPVKCATKPTKGRLAPDGWGAYTPCDLKTDTSAVQGAHCGSSSSISSA